MAKIELLGHLVGHQLGSELVLDEGGKGEEHVESLRHPLLHLVTRLRRTPFKLANKIVVFTSSLSLHGFQPKLAPTQINFLSSCAKGSCHLRFSGIRPLRGYPPLPP